MLWLAAVGALASLLLAFSCLRAAVTVYFGSAKLWTPQLVEGGPEQDLGELGRAVRDSSLWTPQLVEGGGPEQVRDSSLWTPQLVEGHPEQDLGELGRAVRDSSLGTPQLVEDGPEQDLGEPLGLSSGRRLGRAVRDSGATYSPALLVALVLAAAGTLVLGLWPGPLLEMAHSLF
jgi:hypothetical protein